MMPNTQLTIIGCGVLGRALADGLLSQQLTFQDAAQEGRTYSLALTHRRSEVLEKLKSDYPDALVTSNNKDPRIWSPSSLRDEAHRPAHIVVIGTQPQFTAQVCAEIKEMSHGNEAQNLVVVTVCPGITTSQLAGWLPRGTPVVRSMPNTPIEVKQGATAVFANEHMTPELIAEVEAIFKTVSPVVATVPREDLLEVSAAVSGSAPAYIFHTLQSLVAAGIKRGLPAKISRDLVVQSCLGSAMLVQKDAEGATELTQFISDVCVEGGSTQKAVNVLNRHRTEEIVDEAVEASWIANKAMGGEGTADLDVDEADVMQPSAKLPRDLTAVAT